MNVLNRKSSTSSTILEATGKKLDRMMSDLVETKEINASLTIVEEVMDYRTYCCAIAALVQKPSLSGFPVEARAGTKPLNRHSCLVNPFYIPF